MKLFIQGIILSTLTLSTLIANDVVTPTTPRGQSSSGFVPEAPQKKDNNPKPLVTSPIPCTF
jgi:hypothetical protein